MAERLVAMGFPIDWCECALKNSSSLDAAVQQLRQWQEQARRGCIPNVQDYADSNSLTPRSQNGCPPTASVSYSESTGGSTNCVRMFPVTSCADAVVPQALPSELNHQQVPLPKTQERDSIKRKSLAELDRTKKLLRYEKDTPAESIVDNVQGTVVQAPARSTRVDGAGSTRVDGTGFIRVNGATSNMHSSNDLSQGHSQRSSPAGGPFFAPSDVRSHERGRTGRNGGSLDLDGERVRRRDLAFQSAALRMSEAAQIFRGGLQPDVGEIGPAFEFPMCPDEEEDDDDGVDEGWTSIMDIDEPQPHRVSGDPLREADLVYVASTGTSTEDDTRSVDGPEYAPDLQLDVAGNQPLKCAVNQQLEPYDGEHASCGQEQSAKCRGRLPSSSWCPDPPKKLQRTWQYPHDPGIGAADMDGAAGGSRSRSGLWRDQRQPGRVVVEAEDNELDNAMDNDSEAKSQDYQ